MKKITMRMAGGLLGIIAAGVFLFSTCTDDDKENPPPKPEPNPKEKFHIYLAFGQSNMVGYLGMPVAANDNVGNTDKKEWVAEYGFDKPPKNFVVMAAANNNKNPYSREKGEWYPAKPPLVRNNTGLSPADFFGRTVAEAVADQGVKVGVIVVAVDGCAINLFSKDIDEFKAYIRAQEEYMRRQAAAYVDTSVGDIIPLKVDFTTEDYPYKRLVDLATLAQKEGVIKGIIMHQGESGKVTYDAKTGAVGNNGNDSANYAKAVRKIYDDLCEDLGLIPGKVPFLAGQAVGNNNSNINSIPNAFKDLPDTAFVIPSNGCTAWNPNSAENNAKLYHFSFDSYKELGTRYGDKMLELVK